VRSRRLLAILLALGSLLGIGLYARRGREKERVDLYFADGSIAPLDDADAARLISHAKQGLRAART
jgi:hypothetical protein